MLKYRENKDIDEKTKKLLSDTLYFRSFFVGCILIDVTISDERILYK